MRFITMMPQCNAKSKEWINKKGNCTPIDYIAMFLKSISLFLIKKKTKSVQPFLNIDLIDFGKFWSILHTIIDRKDS